MIASGEKKEEYRDIKPFWVKRLGYYHDSDRETGYYFDGFAEFDLVRFARGGHFHSSLPQITLEIEEIVIGKGKPEWGAEPSKTYFVIHLGKITNP